MGNISLPFKHNLLIKLTFCCLFSIALPFSETANAASHINERVNAIIADIMLEIPSGEINFFGEVHHVESFQLAKYEVTQELYHLVMGKIHSYSYGNSQLAPVNGISRQHIDTFLVELNTQTGLQFRLPSEVEWTYAALDTLPSDGVLDSKSVAEVGTHSPNGYGLYDMLGNVAEIVEDPWREENRISQQNSRIANDYIPGKTQKITIKGGSFSESASEVTPHSRDFLGTSTIMSDVGFRLAL